MQLLIFDCFDLQKQELHLVQPKNNIHKEKNAWFIIAWLPRIPSTHQTPSHCSPPPPAPPPWLLTSFLKSRWMKSYGVYSFVWLLVLSIFWRFICTVLSCSLLILIAVEHFMAWLYPFLYWFYWLWIFRLLLVWAIMHNAAIVFLVNIFVFSVEIGYSFGVEMLGYSFEVFF